MDIYGVSFESVAETDRQKILDALKMMNTDATGKMITETPENNTNSSNANKKEDKNESSKVTRNIKGQKEIVIVLPQLNGKGYPLPVNLSAVTK